MRETSIPLGMEGKLALGQLQDAEDHFAFHDSNHSAASDLPSAVSRRWNTQNPGASIRLSLASCINSLAEIVLGPLENRPERIPRIVSVLSFR